MASVRLDKFGGMAPKISHRLLPAHMAVSARNARLLSGELRGARTPQLLYTFPDTTRTATLIRRLNGSTVWFGLESPASDIVKGPLVNDSLERHYWTGESAFVRYNSAARIADGLSSYRLGVPTPDTACAVNVTGGDGLSETRVYTYTFVTVWGEESAPAPVTLQSGYINGIWELTGIAPNGDFTDRVPPEFIRIYRTVTGRGSATYFLVTELPYNTVNHTDAAESVDVARNSVLQSFTWAEPPATLAGLVAHPNGFMVGFNGRDLFFSEAYRPHAWPAEYATTVEDEIVGLTIYNNMIAVLTKGRPVFAAGIRPSNINLIKSEAAEPCLSKMSIASTLSGVLYASPNGMVLYNERGPALITADFLSAEEWALYEPESIKGAQFGNQYIGFYAADRGFRFSPAEPLATFTEIDSLSYVDNVVTDRPTGQLWVLRENKVERWEPTSGIPMYYRWLSKDFDLTRPVNLGAIMLKFNPVADVVTDDRIALYETYNQQFFQAAAPRPPISVATNLQAQTATVSGEGGLGYYYDFAMTVGQFGGYPSDSDERGYDSDGLLINQYGELVPNTAAFLSNEPFLSISSAPGTGPGLYDIEIRVQNAYSRFAFDAVEIEYDAGQTMVLRTRYGAAYGFEFSTLFGETSWRWISAPEGFDGPDVGEVRNIRFWIAYPDTFTGTSALAAQSATVAGTAERIVTGTGALAVQPAGTVGSDIDGAEGTGALAAQAVTIAGEGWAGRAIAVTIAQNPLSSTQYGQDQFAPTTYGSRTPTTYKGATVRITTTTAYDPGGGTVFAYDIALSGLRAQTFFTRLMLEYNPGTYITLLTASTDDFFADGVETWWYWDARAVGWEAADAAAVRNIIFVH